VGLGLDLKVSAHFMIFLMQWPNELLGQSLFYQIYLLFEIPVYLIVKYLLPLDQIS
jgi:hypothetical protein